MANAKSSQVYDFLVIGGDLSGLLIAQTLEHSGLKVGLLEASEQMGGTFRPFYVDGHRLESSLSFVADSHENRDLIQWLEDHLNQKILGQAKELIPLTFDSGQMKTFMGFGDRRFKSLEILALYNQSQVIQLLIPPDEWVRLLSESLVGDQMTLALPTQIRTAGEIMEVTVNGNRTLNSRKVIFASTARSLLSLLHEDQLPNRLRQRIAKSRLWTSLSLHCIHSTKISETEALHFLYGSRDDFDPTIGRVFLNHAGGSGATSLWMSFLDSESADDAEIIANCLREIKKQLKRAYPQFPDTVSAEKLVVREASHGVVDLGLKEPGIIPDIPNLFMADHTQTGMIPLLGSLSVAREAIRWALAQQDLLPEKGGHLVPSAEN